MPTTKEVNIQKLGIIAGGGEIPAQLVVCCKNKNIQPYIIGFKKQTMPEIMNGDHCLWAGLGQAGKIINFFKSNGVKNLVMIGSIKRPAFSELKPDLKGAKILSQIGRKGLGDNGILDFLKDTLVKEGFALCGVHEFCDDLLAHEGVWGKYKPSDLCLQDIGLGIKISQEIGRLDIGQSVIVQNGIVLAVEGAEGTDDLIMRSASLQKKGEGAVLVKTRKPQQSMDLDLPTIGIKTLENAYKAGFSGIAVHASNLLVVEKEHVLRYADDYGLFIIGTDI